MAGGIGSRFWPISRTGRPKQFLDILGTGKTFIRSTFERFLPVVPVENFLVVTNAGYKEIVLEQLPELTPMQVLAEPVGRNTAPCIAYAAFRLAGTDPDAVMIVSPSDHLILNEQDFCRVIGECSDFVAGGDALMTIGIKPTRPDTGYGYIQTEAGEEPVRKVKTFTEKPDLEMAKAFLASGEFMWNSGIFVWRADTILRNFAEFLPELYQMFDSASGSYGTLDEARLIDGIYPECRSVSIDVGIMEKARNVYVRCSDFGWSDIGTWGSLYQYSVKDDRGNAVTGDTVLYDTEGCVVNVAPGRLAVIEGARDMIVVDTDDVLMVCRRESEQAIKSFVDDIRFNKGDKFI